ncbi:MAG TPA: BamA/TamA family outer membrane protein, partial [Chitinophagaceae bacterium]|nr:BamA/TamA family outer membrane protein [Chitinophagaceae bacterium]
AGHDHGLQLIRDSSYYIVSGGGSKTNRVSQGKKSLYAERARGFAVMEVSTNKNVTVSFYTVTDSVRNSFGTTLLNFSSVPEPTGDSAKREVNIPNLQYKDTFTISASEKHPPVKGFKKSILGQNYRPEWSAPVNMKVFNLKKERGGFEMKGLGGSVQTRSLRLQDKNGKDWVLRPLDKIPTGALPPEFRSTIAPDLIRDLNSASHPYAALTVPELAKALDIVVPHPELFFVPDDPALGFYRPYFANKVCMLEERDASFKASETKSTAKVLNQLIEDNDHRADQFAVLKARLLDIVIGDFDRNMDQWKWATTDTGKGKLYFPIPRDRDEVFFNSDGWLLKRSSKNLLPFLVGFKKDIPHVNWFNYTARDFDRIFLTDLDEKDWKETITKVQQELTDSVITKAVKKLPKEIYPIDGKTIEDKLISRRNALTKAGETYYRFISREVNVVGSNQKEYFKVSNHGEGLQVRMYARAEGNDTSFMMYDRIFEPSNTREIRLYGLGEDDVFDVDENAKSRIKLRVIGGKGNDTFNIRGNVKNLIYDMKVEGNYVQHGSHTKNRFSKDPPVNSYSILGYKYNTSEFPRIQIGANSDDGFILGAGFAKRTYGFRNDPYATDQKFDIYHSFKTGSYRLKYDGEFNHITHNIDLLVKAKLGLPDIINFFGLGNTTKIADDKSYDFYKAQFKSTELQLLVRQRVFEKMQLIIGPYFYNYSNKYADNADGILGKSSLANQHLDSADIYSDKTYLGARLAMKFDNRNNLVFPTRGIFWDNEFVSAAGLTKTSNTFTKLSSDMTIYASLTDPAKLIGVVSFGGSRIFSKSFEFFQAVDIGNNNLHGFRANRYLGKSSLYGSTELRYRLFNLKSYLIPGPVGLTGFFDIGRVWLDGEDSKVWRKAYGGGFYFIPFNKFMVTGSVGFSGNENMFNFVLGTKINLSY